MTLLRNARIKTGMKQGELAVKAGVQSSRLCVWERGERCNQATAQRLANALGVPVRDVFPDFDNLRPY